MRRALHARGVRYRLHASELPGRPDVVIRRYRLALFVDGDFWHGNPERWLQRGLPDMASMFPTRAEWWVAKIQRNVERDKRITAELESAGWNVIRIWESAVLADPDEAADTVVAAISAARRRNATRTRAAHAGTSMKPR